MNLLINWKGSRSKIILKDCHEGNGKPARTLSLNIQPPYKYPNHFNFTKTKANSPLPVIKMSKTIFFKISYAHPAGDMTRVSVMPRKVTVKIGDAENRCRGFGDKNR